MTDVFFCKVVFHKIRDGIIPRIDVVIKMNQGIFITLEGNDGAGKTTLCMNLICELEKLGYSTIYTREPGGSQIAEQIRNVLLKEENTNMDARTEALLFAASRRQHLVEVVLPALQENKIVLCDRFVDSSLAYQGYARNIGIDEVWELNQFAIHDCMPHKTLFLKVSVETGKKRMALRGETNRLDLEEDDFHKKVREGYEILLKKFPERITVIDAEKGEEEVLQQALQEILEVLSQHE